MEEMIHKIITAVRWQLIGVPKEQYLIVVLFVAAFMISTFAIKRVGAVNEIKLKKIRATILLIGYFILVGFITLLRRDPGVQTNYFLIPFANYFDPYGGVNQKAILYSFLNILLFVPYGAIVSWITKEKDNSFIKFTILTGFIISSFIEVTQFLTRRGTFETEDLILNTIGTLVGVWCERWVVKLTVSYRKRTKKKGHNHTS